MDHLRAPLVEVVTHGILSSHPSSIPIIDEKVDESAIYIKNAVDSYLTQNNICWNDVILMGRSQGAVLVMYLVLSGMTSPDKSIAIVPSYPKELFERGIRNKSTEIIWIDAKNDTRRTSVKEADCQRLINAGCSIRHLMDDNSDHDNLTNSMVDLLINSL